MNNSEYLISIIIPVYGSTDILRNLYQRINNTFFDFSENFEIIFIDDCGPQNSWKIINEIASFDSRVKAFKLSRNFGQHNAILCGIREAKGNLIITMDDDLQHPPEEIPKLIVELEKGFDVVYGKPIKEKRSFLRNLITRITKFTLRQAIGSSVSNNISSFRIFKSFLRNSFKDFDNEIVNIDILLNYSTNKFSSIKVLHEERSEGKSGYTLRKLIHHTFNLLTGFSTAPLHLATFIGITLSIFGIFIFFYVTLKWFFYGSVVRGFTFISALIAIFSGSQLLALGILGEYISRIHNNLLKKPSYVIKEKI